MDERERRRSVARKAKAKAGADPSLSTCAMLTRVRRTGAGTPEDEFRRAVFAACLCWTEEEGTSKIVGLASNKVVRLPRPRALPVMRV